jgi:hypothetical protein
MPEVSRFYGIVISMYFKEHNPPHFHADFGEYSAQFNIETLQMMEGKMPRRAKGFILEWADEHRVELMANWNAIRNREPFSKIEPLQ